MTDDPATERLWLIRARRSCCPGCDAAHLAAGPLGGMSRNVYCAHCMQGWNITTWRGALVRVECIGPIDEERLAFAVGQYPDEQPWRVDLA